jgi:hypothetical protein
MVLPNPVWARKALGSKALESNVRALRGDIKTSRGGHPRTAIVYLTENGDTKKSMFVTKSEQGEEAIAFHGSCPIKCAILDRRI